LIVVRDSTTRGVSDSLPGKRSGCHMLFGSPFWPSEQVGFRVFWVI
jgi:hypothetical protein